MQIDLNIPEPLIRKIRALNILVQGSADIESLLVSLIEQTVNSAIIEALESGETPELQAKRQKQDSWSKTAAPPQPDHDFDFNEQDATGISDGLGDDEEDEPLAPTRDPEAFVAKQGGLTDDILDRDMQVRDPSHEAKVDAGTFADEIRGQSAEEAFSAISGLPSVSFEYEEDPRISKRKKRVNSRARVSAFDGREENRI